MDTRIVGRLEIPGIAVLLKVAFVPPLSGPVSLMSASGCELTGPLDCYQLGEKLQNFEPDQFQEVR